MGSGMVRDQVQDKASKREDKSINKITMMVRTLPTSKDMLMITMVINMTRDSSRKTTMAGTWRMNHRLMSKMTITKAIKNVLLREANKQRTTMKTKLRTTSTIQKTSSKLKSTAQVHRNQN
ncbi:hypothetical protein ACKRZS_004119 [Fusarium odoratissimum]